MVVLMKKQKIYIDGLCLVDGHFSGVGQYVLGIVRGLDELLEIKKYQGEDVPEIRIIIPRDKIEHFKKFGFKYVGYKKFPLPFRYMTGFWHRRILPPIDLWCGKGTYIFPHFVDMPLLFNKSAALVIFDLSYELHREYSDEGNALFLSKNVRESVDKTENIIAISKNARKEIIDFYGVKKDKVFVATPATDPKKFYRRSDKEIEKAKEKYGIKGDYILALSNLEPRKNLASLVDAYCSLPKEITDKNALLLVGVSGWKTEKLFQKIVEKVEEGYNIIRPSKYVHDNDKPAIISGAKMLVYPSHYEGFGMPPLEALACGVPVITADNSSLPEVVGKVGKMVKSNDVDGLKKEILNILNNYDKISSEVREAGPRQAEVFSWQKSAQVFLDSVENIK